jgi:hypothetical protein
MKLAQGRLLVVVVLFVAWLGYLAFLVTCRPHLPTGLRGAFEGQPLTLSRPQVLASTLDVIAEVNDVTGDDVTVVEVLYPLENAPVKKGDKIKVENVEQCRPQLDPIKKNQETPLDWTGPGHYLLPLQLVKRDDKSIYEVTATPVSPGYPHPESVGGWVVTPKGMGHVRSIERDGEGLPKVVVELKDGERISYRLKDLATPRIYPDTPQLRREYHSVAKP